MIKQKQKQRGMFDEEHCLEKLNAQKDPLLKLSAHIDFEFFRRALEEYFASIRPKDESLGGRPHYDYVLMFKVLVLQHYYELSDDAMEYALLDRLSFKRFLGLSLSDAMPDAKTIWNFRNELAKGEMIKQLFKKLYRQLDNDRIVVHKGKMVDATLVSAPVQRNSREENNKIKQGEIPQSWEQNPSKLRQKDTDASWVTHHGKDHYGYKDHIKADTKTKLITAYTVTPAHVHDSEELFELLDKSDCHQPLHADSAYRSEETEEKLRKKNIRSHVHEKGYRNKPLTKAQQKRNHRKSKVRSRIEHIFAFMTNSMNGIRVRCRNIMRAACAIGMKNLTYNLFRLTQLKIILTG